jgi:maleamate amidohydrolase
MQKTDKTSKQIYEDWKRAPRVPPFGMGSRPCILNIDLQRRYTDKATFSSAYEADPEQFALINALSRRVRDLGLPVIWT